MRLGLSTPVVIQQPGIASPWEVADMVAFLARAGAGSITGQAIPIDGGATARA